MQCEGSEAATITTGGAQFLNASSQLLDHYVSYVSTRMELEQLGALAFNFRVEVSSFRPAQGWGRAAHKHTYLSIYIYIYIERERETSIIYIYIYIYILYCTHLVVPATGASGTPPGSQPHCCHHPAKTLTEAAAAGR